MTKKKIAIIVISVLLVLAIAVGCYFTLGQSEELKLSVDEAEKIVNSTFDKISDDGTRLEKPAEYIAEKNNIEVKKVTYDNKRIILDCSITTLDAHAAISPYYDSFLDTSLINEGTKQVKSSLDFQIDFRKPLLELVKTAAVKTVDTKIYIYNVDGVPVIYTSDESINAVFGGIGDIATDIRAKTTYMSVDEDGNTVKKEIDTTNDNIRKGFIECLTVRHDPNEPDTSGPIGQFINKLKKDFDQNFIQHDRWKTIFKGLWITLQITFFSLIIGVVLGFLVAFVRCAHIKSKKKGVILNLINSICQLYLTVIRGTPVVVQILIIHFVILQPMGISTFVSAVACFGINSGAYVAEIVRGGIMSVDPGQEEAGRSLGFNYAQTMWHIIMPQAFKTVLPSLANEFVVLLKETSIAFYIGLKDLMYEVNGIRAATYSAFMPLIASAVIYLILVLTFSKLVNILERRLRNSER